MLFSECFRKPVFHDGIYRYMARRAPVNDWDIFQKYAPFELDKDIRDSVTDDYLTKDFEVTENFMLFQPEGTWFATVRPTTWGKSTMLFWIRFNNPADYALFRLMGIGGLT